MLAKLITVRFDPRIEGFDDEPLRAFLRGRDVVDVKEQFFVREEVPYWTFLVTYNLAPGEGAGIEGDDQEQVVM